MSVTEPSKILTKSNLDSVVRLTTILTNVHNRVSRLNSTSNNSLKCSGIGLIDKLEIFLPDKVNAQSIIDRCELLGFNVTSKYKRDKRYYLIINTGNQIIDCSLGVPNNTEFNKVIINPSKTKKYSQTESKLLLLFGKTVLDSRVYRIDFTVDIYEEYESVLRGLDVKYKKTNVEYMGGSIRTGLLIGAGKDKILIYNKAKKEKVEKPWTRIERQVSGAKVPVKRLGDLKHSLPKILDFNPLEAVTLNLLSLKDRGKSTPIQSEQVNDFRALIKHEGYFLTRKKLNKNKNFKRDYAKYFNLQPYLKQPKDIFKTHIIDYLEED